MTYKEHLIFVASQRDAGGCFWLPLANVCWREGEKKPVVSIKGRPQDRFVYASEAETFASEIAQEWVDNHIRNDPQARIFDILTTHPSNRSYELWCSANNADSFRGAGYYVDNY